MNTPHAEVLAHLERAVASPNALPHEIDERVATTLGVPASDYFAYVVVAGAIERYAEQLHRQQQLPLGDEAAPRSAEPAWLLAEMIASAAAAVCLEASREEHRELNLAAARIYTAAEQLRCRLADLRLEFDFGSGLDHSDVLVATDGR